MEDREISREEAIKRLEGGAPFSEIYEPLWEDSLALAVKALKAERHGRWIKDDTGAEYCSNCYKYPYDVGGNHIVNWHSNYCPNCRAKMDEVEDV